MGNKINALATRLRESIEMRDALDKLQKNNNSVARKIHIRFSDQVQAMSGKVMRQVTEIQDGASVRGLTLSPVNEMRMPAQAVCNFLYEVYDDDDPVTEFSFYDDHDNLIELDEMDIEWLYKRLHVDAKRLAKGNCKM